MRCRRVAERGERHAGNVSSNSTCDGLGACLRVCDLTMSAVILIIVSTIDDHKLVDLTNFSALKFATQQA